MFELLQLVHEYFVIPLVVVALIIWLVGLFVLRYRNPAKNLSKQLRSITTELKAVEGDPKKTQIRQLLNAKFNAAPLDHPWQMYKNTLHEVKESIDGEVVVVGYRSTASSEYFFAQSLIVDTTLRIEFFKHIPSIMTGIGIIGTFLGLLLGLSQFDPAGDPANVQNSLALLLHGVRDAFLASFVAIGGAMILTWNEKSWLRTCYEDLEQLTSAIDSLFEADTLGEEYLEQLVKSAQDSATQTKQLKDSLVSDLKAMMENLTSAQQTSQQELTRQIIESSTKNSSDMASQIGQSIAEGLQLPLEKIVSSVQQINGNQSAAVETLLKDVLSAFTDRLESTFGNQMNGVGDMMTQSVTAMREMQLGFNQLIGDMRSNSEASSKALEQQMLNMLTEIQQKQNDMGNTMNDMLGKVQQSVAQIGDTGADAAEKMNKQVKDLLSQTSETMTRLMVDIGETKRLQDHAVLESQKAIQQTSAEALDQMTLQIADVLSQTKNHTNGLMASIEEKNNTQDRIALENQQALRQMSNGMLDQLSQHFNRMIEQTNQGVQSMMHDIATNKEKQDRMMLENQQELQQHTTKLLNQLTERVSALLLESQNTLQSTRQNIEKLNQVSISGIQGMNDGAEKMRLAADRFNTAGTSLSMVAEGCSSLLAQANTASHHLASTASELTSIVGDYRQSRESVDQAILVLKDLVDKAVSEAGMSSQMLADMQKMMQSIQVVERELQQYSSQVNDVLVQSFDSFGAAVENSLTRSLGSFDNTLDQAVSRLASGIESLNDIAEELADMAQRNARRA